MSERRPRLAVIVANAITGDSRVQKTALAAAREGWEVYLIGRSHSPELERSRLGAVKIIRVPVEKEIAKGERLRRRTAGAGPLVRSAVNPALQPVRDARHESELRQRDEEIARLRSTGGGPVSELTQFGLRGRSWWQRKRHAVRGRVVDWQSERAVDPEAPLGDWRLDQPNLLDLDLAFGPVLERLRPDVIHVNDITMLPAGAISASRMRAAGHSVAWIYDAHEYVDGVEWPTPRMNSAYPEVEREYIHQADAVVTVSPEIAAVLQQEHRLESTPLVVRNTPIREVVGQSGHLSVRTVAGVGDEVPLLVYSGYLHVERGLDTAIGALPHLPEVHLAVVTSSNNNKLARQLRQIAEQTGVSDRLHLVPYVDQHQVADYLSSADVGVICSLRTPNYELSLPTKLAEYLHAGLPVLCSDLRTLSAFVREHDLGAIFEPGDVESFVAAASAVLERRHGERRPIPEELLDELSWETQTRRLLDLYQEVSGVAPQRTGKAVSWTVSERAVRGKQPATTPEDETEESTTPWRPLDPRSRIRLGLGPANFAGQLATLATAVTTARGEVSAEVTMNTTPDSFGYPADVYVPQRSLRRLDVQQEQLSRILPRYTHLIADAFRPVFGNLNGPDIAADLPALRRAKISVALLAHGSEIRHPLRHLERHPFSHYLDAPEGRLEALTALAERNRRIADTSDLPLFVTTPDLLDDLPTATWIPLIVDVDDWASDAPVLERSRPVVLHAPSRRWTKGTDRFMPQLEALAERGIIELDLAEGVPWTQMRERVQRADIVIDQFGVGCYGTLACEAMAAGRPVIAYLTDTVAEVVGEVPPIVNASADEVGAAVERLLDDREATAELGRASLAFVRKYHDGRRSVQALSRFLR